MALESSPATRLIVRSARCCTGIVGCRAGVAPHGAIAVVCLSSSAVLLRLLSDPIHLRALHEATGYTASHLVALAASELAVSVEGIVDGKRQEQEPRAQNPVHVLLGAERLERVLAGDDVLDAEADRVQRLQEADHSIEDVEQEARVVVANGSAEEHDGSEHFHEARAHREQHSQREH